MHGATRRGVRGTRPRPRPSVGSAAAAHGQRNRVGPNERSSHVSEVPVSLRCPCPGVLRCPCPGVSSSEVSVSRPQLGNGELRRGAWTWTNASGHTRTGTWAGADGQCRARRKRGEKGGRKEEREGGGERERQRQRERERAREIGRASCRERVSSPVYISVVAV